MKDIVILGSGGQGKDVLVLLEENNAIKQEWNILGFADEFSKCDEVDGYPILGGDEWLMQYPHTINVAVALGTSGLRKKVIEKYAYSAPNLLFPTIVSHHAHVSKRAKIGMGSVVAVSGIVMSGAVIGDFALINYDTTVGHDAVIGDFVTLNPSVNISGNVKIEACTDVGTGAHIIQGLHIGAGSVVGAGSVIVRDVPDHCTVVGNPGRIIVKK